MGAKLLSATAGTLVMVGVIDLFVLWYGRFLQKRMPNVKARIMLRRLVWVILAVMFWSFLSARGMPDYFGSTYFLFFLFIYSVRGLIAAFFQKGTGS